MLALATKVRRDVSIESLRVDAVSIDTTTKFAWPEDSGRSFWLQKPKGASRSFRLDGITFQKIKPWGIPKGVESNAQGFLPEESFAFDDKLTMTVAVDGLSRSKHASLLAYEKHLQAGVITNLGAMGCTEEGSGDITETVRLITPANDDRPEIMSIKVQGWGDAITRVHTKSGDNDDGSSYEFIDKFEWVTKDANATAATGRTGVPQKPRFSRIKIPKCTLFVLRLTENKVTSIVPLRKDGSLFWGPLLKDELGRVRWRKVGPQDCLEGTLGDVDVDVTAVNVRNVVEDGVPQKHLSLSCNVARVMIYPPRYDAPALDEDAAQEIVFASTEDVMRFVEEENKAAAGFSTVSVLASAVPAAVPTSASASVAAIDPPPKPMPVAVAVPVAGTKRKAEAAPEEGAGDWVCFDPYGSEKFCSRGKYSHSYCLYWN